MFPGPSLPAFTALLCGRPDSFRIKLADRGASSGIAKQITEQVAHRLGIQVLRHALGIIGLGSKAHHHQQNDVDDQARYTFVQPRDR